MNLASWLWRLLSRALAPWGELCWDVLLERSLLEDLPALHPDIEVTLRLAQPADLDRIVPMYSSDPWLYLGDVSRAPEARARARELYLDRLRRGELCFLAISGGEIAHVNWICFTWGDALPDHPIRLRAGEVYTTDALTPPAFRGKALHAFVLRAMLAHARERGERHAYTLSRIDRTDSHKGLYRLGWRECGRALYFLQRRKTAPRFLWRQGNLEPLFRPPVPLQSAG